MCGRTPFFFCVLAPLRKVVILPGLPALDLSRLLLPHIGGSLGLVGFGVRKDFRLKQAFGVLKPFELADRFMRWGAFLTVKDTAAFLAAWSPVLETLKAQGYDVKETQTKGFKILDLKKDKKLLGSVLIRGKRLFLVRFKRDRQALLATAKGKRSALKKRLDDPVALATVTGKGCLVCGYAQFVRLTRDLRRLGAPTFHMQLLGSIRQMVMRLEPGKISQRIRFRIDF